MVALNGSENSVENGPQFHAEWAIDGGDWERLHDICGGRHVEFGLLSAAKERDRYCCEGILEVCFLGISDQEATYLDDADALAYPNDVSESKAAQKANYNNEFDQGVTRIEVEVERSPPIKMMGMKKMKGVDCLFNGAQFSGGRVVKKESNVRYSRVDHLAICGKLKSCFKRMGFCHRDWSRLTANAS